MSTEALAQEIERIAADAHLAQVAVCVCDPERGRRFAHRADVLLHAASTFKAAILLALLREAATGAVEWRDHLQVRNRFLSVTTGAPFRIERERDGDATVHAALGKSLRLEQLARAMIVRSSNLATNLLLDFLGVARVCVTLAECGVRGVEVRRGVEDLAAHAAGINNEATAEGLCSVFRCFLEEPALPEPWREVGLDILRAQEFNRMLPARLPKGVMVAHKTGEISTHCHDAGIVFPPERGPYLVSILTEISEKSHHPQRAVAEISAALYHAVLEGLP